MTNFKEMNQRVDVFSSHLWVVRWRDVGGTPLRTGLHDVPTNSRFNGLVVMISVSHVVFTEGLQFDPGLNQLFAFLLL